MQFHIDGRFQAEIRRENEAWAVYRAEPAAVAKLDEAVVNAELDEDDLASYLDELFLDWAGPEA